MFWGFIVGIAPLSILLFATDLVPLWVGILLGLVYFFLFCKKPEIYPYLCLALYILSAIFIVTGKIPLYNHGLKSVMGFIVFWGGLVGVIYGNVEYTKELIEDKKEKNKKPRN